MTPAVEKIGDLAVVMSETDAYLFSRHEPLLALPLTPARRNPPLPTAILAIRALRPVAPKLNLDAVRESSQVGAYYRPANDEICVFRRGEMDEQELSETLLHELIHAVAHGSRLACYKFTGNDDLSVRILDVLPAAFPELDHVGQKEEIIAAVGSSILCVRLGLEPRYSASVAHWIFHAAALSPASLKEAIAEAHRRVDFILCHD